MSIARGNAPGKMEQKKNRPRANVEKRDILISDEMEQTKTRQKKTNIE
jgi:hypothetical protein